MSIKTRLTISNLLMLFVPVLLIAAIVLGTFGAMMLYYHGEIGELGENQGSVSIARELVSHFLHEQSEVYHPDVLPALIDALNGMDYHLQISRGGKIVFSNLTSTESTAVQTKLGSFADSGGALILAEGTTALVRNSALVNGSPVTLVAFNGSVTQKGGLATQVGDFLRQYLSLVVVASLVIVTLINLVLTNQVARSFLKPLRLLGEGSRRIRDGDLEFSLSYGGQDEFREVCDDFDAMRLRLRDSVQTQIKYEETRRGFIAEVSHDLRTPLTAILGYVEGLRDGIADTPEKQAHYLEVIHRKACDMDELVDRLFLLSKMETGHFPFWFEPTDLCIFLRQYVKSVSEEFSAKGETLLLEELPDEPQLVRLDSDQMRWVLTNLLENSVKYRARETGSVKISLRPGQDGVELLLADDGPGVPAQDLPLLFESFFRGDKARSNPGDGSGLGLAIARRIVEAHHGTIGAVSENGLTILIRLQWEVPQ